MSVNLKCLETVLEGVLLGLCIPSAITFWAPSQYKDCLIYVWRFLAMAIPGKTVYLIETASWVLCTLLAALTSLQMIELLRSHELMHFLLGWFRSSSDTLGNIASSDSLLTHTKKPLSKSVLTQHCDKSPELFKWKMHWTTVVIHHKGYIFENLCS